MQLLESKQRVQKIAELNDIFRTSLTGGRIALTSGVVALGHRAQIDVLRAVQQFNAFSEHNDPYGEHDFGFFKVGANEFFWKIDYYDPTLSRHTNDAADPAVTVRVLTVMLTEEY